MKILLASLKETSRTCPSAWEASTPDGVDVKISYRTGRLDVIIKGVVELRTGREPICVSSYILLPEVLELLKKEGVEFE